MLPDSQSEGDTQPISQSIYEQYSTRANVHHNNTTRQPSHDAIEAHQVTTLAPQEDEPGHVGLQAACERPPAKHDAEAFGVMGDDAEIDPLSQPQDIRAEIFPESKRFQPPETPGLQDTKRKRQIETPSEGLPTPKLPVNPFANQPSSVDGLMSASQLFQATQAVTSPLTNIVVSDGLSERPSPIMHELQRPSTAGLLSSPVRPPQSSMVRAVTEPQAVYVSMKESQEARDRYLQARRAERGLSPSALSDDEFDDDPQLKRRLRQQKYNLEAKKQFAEVAARSATVTRRLQHSRRDQIIDVDGRESLTKRGAQVGEPVLISDDGPVEDAQGSITEEETEREEDVEDVDDKDIDELGEDNKENIEVPATISRVRPVRAQVISSQPTPSRKELPVFRVASPSKSNVQVLGSSQVSRSQENSRYIEIGSSADAIADSQPSQNHAHFKSYGKSRATRAFSEPRSSLDSRVLVPQSQFSDESGALQSSTIMKERLGVPNPPISPPNRRQSSPKDVSGSGNDHTFVQSAKSVVLTQELQIEDLKKAPEPHRMAPESTIPESIDDGEGRCLPKSDTFGMLHTHGSGQSASKEPSASSIPNGTRGSTLFETAPECPGKEPSALSPQRRLLRSQSVHSSPEKLRLPRTMSDIAADPSPPDMIGEVNIEMNILSDEDRQFRRIVDGSSPIAPSRKRRRVGRGFAVRSEDIDVLQNLPASPLPPPSSAVSKITPVKMTSAGITPVPSSSPMQPINPTMAIRNEKLREENHPNAEPELEPTRIQELDSKAIAVADGPNMAITSRIAADPENEISAKDMAADIRQNRTDNEGIASGPLATVPKRVFALFNGRVPAYHPATCLEVATSGASRYRVRFDDGTVDTISAYGIKRLELKNGDCVKVDLPGLRGKRYVVEGMRDPHRPTTPPDPSTPSRRGRQHSTNDSAFPETDIHGFATVLASPVPTSARDCSEAGTSQKAIPLSQIYFTQTLWASFRNRPYTHASPLMNMVTGLQTPSERPSTPSTPSSRTRRMTKATGLAYAHSKGSNNRPRGGIFKNMVFTITNVDRAEDSNRAKEYIIKNDGRVLEDGFDELFDVPVLYQASDLMDPSRASEASFYLTPEAREVGFTCLIADRYCRRAKFIQALALGIPCLATRWVTDCAAKQRVLPWGPYLLPAGESTFLGGAVRSRNLFPFPAEAANLAEMAANRSKLLEDTSVLLIMEKGQEKIMKQHPLITHALGASRVSRAVNMEAAAKAIADAQALNNPWDWVFSYDKEKEVERRLFGSSGTGKKRKRGRDSEAPDLQEKRAKTKVVGNEFVIQSLILGMLIDK